MEKELEERAARAEAQLSREKVEYGDYVRESKERISHLENEILRMRRIIDEERRNTTRESAEKERLLQEIKVCTHAKLLPCQLTLLR